MSVEEPALGLRDQRREVLRELGRQVADLAAPHDPAERGEDGSGMTLRGRDVDVLSRRHPAQELVHVEALRRRRRVKPRAELRGQQLRDIAGLALRDAFRERRQHRSRGALRVLAADARLLLDGREEPLGRLAHARSPQSPVRTAETSSRILTSSPTSSPPAASRCCQVRPNSVRSIDAVGRDADALVAPWVDGRALDGRVERHLARDVLDREIADDAVAAALHAARSGSTRSGSRGSGRRRRSPGRAGARRGPDGRCRCWPPARCRRRATRRGPRAPRSCRRTP